ncbi:MAG: secretion protein HlyD family protein [Caulobacteraceae bacterium]|nr:secretion protein HlyD family protein [Caulobacteraceae bacterium]
MSEGLGSQSNGGRSIGQRLRWPLLIGGPAIVIAVVAYFILTGGRYQSTDDAYVMAARTPISANVSARVVELAVRDNQPVKKGQLLFRLDDRDFKAALAQAQAQLATARLQVQTQRATAGQQSAAVTEAQAGLDYAQRELARQKVLAGGGVASQQQLDQARNAADEARAHLEAIRQQAVAARTAAGADNSPIDAQPAVMQALAALQRAQLAVGYTTIVAPQDGVVTKVEQIQLGSYITAAQPLFWLVSGRPYIEADFKEDQLAKMRVGQLAAIAIDAARGQKLQGRVASFSPGAGSTFSILPAQNATGNWVKVVQRLPVRIEFDQPPPAMASHAGLSANVKVDTGPAGR